MEPKDQASQSVSPTVSAAPETSAAVHSTLFEPVTQPETQQIKPAPPKEMIELIDDNGFYRDQSATSVPRQKTPVSLTVPDPPTTGQSRSATDATANS